MLNKFEVFQIAKLFYWECKGIVLPSYLKDQLLRASSSIALNIAEGSGKKTPNDQSKYYSIALGSLREFQAIIEIEKIENPVMIEYADRLGAILFTLTKKSNR